MVLILLPVPRCCRCLPLGQALHTLRTYLDSGRNISATAQRLHLHRNTVRYRVARITDQLEVDLDDPDERLLV